MKASAEQGTTRVQSVAWAAGFFPVGALQFALPPAGWEVLLLIAERVSPKARLSEAVKRRAFFGFCGLVAFALCILVSRGGAGWDLAIYHRAIQALAAGHDPYADAMAIQRMVHSQLASHPNVPTPYSYVYSPITLPILRLLVPIPVWISGTAYWLVYIAAVIAQIWVMLQATTTGERRYFLFLAPVATFFPGLLATDNLLSGNVAYILYGAVLLTAVLGWRRGRWLWFYLCVVLASCVKAPLLSLAVIPVLTARRQVIPAALTVVAGVGLFAVQPLIWPNLFLHYLQAVELQFSFNRDFGCSPAGLFSGFLYDRHIAYSPGGLIFFACYAVPVLLLLLILSREFKDGRFSLQQWVPVMLVGVLLLNPRLIEYDVAPLTIPLALIAWRFMIGRTTPRRSGFTLALLFVAANAFALSKWTYWKMTEGPLLVVFFLAGGWTLLQQDGGAAAESEELEDQTEELPTMAAGR